LASGLGDITIYPFMLGWTNGPDLKYDVRVGIYAPSGEVRRFASAANQFKTVFSELNPTADGMLRFAFMMMFFTLSETGGKENLPLITIPAE
jgi:hypothetical protein